MTRRDFIRDTAVGTAGVLASAGLLQAATGAQSKSLPISIVVDGADPLLHQPPVRWAVEQLKAALKSKGLAPQIFAELGQTPRRSECVVVSHPGSVAGRQLLEQGRISLPAGPETIGLARTKAEGRSVALVCGSDVRGLVYGLLDVADQVVLGDEPLARLRGLETTVEKPANVIRSIARCFVSDVEDKAWFNDRSFWERYLTMLARERFNRFSLTLGIGYDFATDIRDCYFHFAYPFLVSVPGHNVRAAPLPDAERDSNLQMLQFISEETAKRGLHFQVGLWTHAYQWHNSPNANYTIEGLTPDNHAAYCRDAAHALLRACPAINGITFRIHGESGVPEGSYGFWKTVFDGLVKSGRRIEIDMHAKGIDQAMIEVALTTGLPVNVSPKFWAEHMGLPYMQGAIRTLEMPPREGKDTGFFSKSSGSRRFLRYGYGDLLAEDRRYGVLHRIWPGTQRLLLWGSPEMAAAYGRTFSFCGSAGVEICEPLSFKGRKGSGREGGREAYADTSLRATGGDFEKYLYTYCVWGRRLYDPDCKPEVSQRFLRAQLGAGAPRVESALSRASLILPLVTTAHCPSAANNNYWPEMYTNMPMVDAKRPHPYGDSPSPKRFGSVSSLDPEFFSGVDEFADELIRGAQSARYSPARVAEWLDGAAASAEAFLREARPRVRDAQSPLFRRLATDVSIQAGLGRFFAWKFRAGVLYALYERSNYRPALEQALAAYRQARVAWADLAEWAKEAYVLDVTFGYEKHLRGHWLDRLTAIDQDIADLEQLRHGPREGKPSMTEAGASRIEQAIRSVLAPPRKFSESLATSLHRLPARFVPGKPLIIRVGGAEAGHLPRMAAIRMRYRHVNQGESWQVQEMEREATGYRGVILGTYTESPFPLQYHFELKPVAGAAWFYPGFGPDLLGQPYFVLRKSS